MKNPFKSLLAVAISAIILAGCTDQVVDLTSQNGVAATVSPFEAAAVDMSDPVSSASKLSSLVTDCTFTTSGTTMTLNGDCTTDGTISIPDGMTLDGGGHTITAVDPPAAHFLGAIVTNGGTIAHVRNLTLTASGLASACKAGADRLRGIMFEGASGSITDNTIDGVNKGASGCQEGNSIEVRNAPFDGTHPNTQTVEISGNTVTNYQKTGILANGDVLVSINKNDVGASATQHNLAANGIQLGFGAAGEVVKNKVEGNQWFGPSDFAATAVLVYLTGPVNVSKNHIRGNAGIGIYGLADGGTYDNNKVFDEGPDGGHYDIGVGNYGANNAFTNNKVKGYDVAYDGVTDGNNKVVGGPGV